MRQRLFIALVALTGCLDTPTGQGPMNSGPESPRVLDGLQVLYTFDEGEGLVVKDKSGVEPAFDLQLDNLVNNEWVAGGGIDIVGPSVITSTDVAIKVFVACVQANAVTLEAWIQPADVMQNGTIFTYGKQDKRNAALSVENTRYAGSVLTSRPNPDVPGETIQTVETVRTPDNVVKPSVQHVVYTRDVTGATMYVDGVDTSLASGAMQPSPSEPKPMTDQTEWSPSYQLAIGAQTNARSPWLGRVYLAAIYCRRLTTAEVQKNFGAGY